MQTQARPAFGGAAVAAEDIGKPGSFDASDTTASTDSGQQQTRISEPTRQACAAMYRDAIRKQLAAVADAADWALGSVDDAALMYSANLLINHAVQLGENVVDFKRYKIGAAS